MGMRTPLDLARDGHEPLGGRGHAVVDLARMTSMSLSAQLERESHVTVPDVEVLLVIIVSVSTIPRG